MKYDSLRDSRGNRNALENLCSRIGRRDCSVMDIEDAIEDATTAEELRDNINALHLLYDFSIDRVTSEYVRLIRTDVLGNKLYLKAKF